MNEEYGEEFRSVESPNLLRKSKTAVNQNSGLLSKQIQLMDPGELYKFDTAPSNQELITNS